MFLQRIFSLSTSLFILILLCRCGVVSYPGQAGMVTNNYNKVDMEYLDEPGLFVYETVYDNRAGGQGVGAIVTKLYPGAKTYTSNVRTNAEGTVYRVKSQYDGAEVQMISVPKLNQVHMSPNHKIAFLIEYANSLDELDDKNIAEQGLFKKMEFGLALTKQALETKKLRWEFLRAGSLAPNGNLSYEVTGMEMNQMKFVPSKAVVLETNFFGSSVKTTFTPEIKAELTQFLETNFPKGYNGVVNMSVKGAFDPVPLKIGIHTLKTLEASGTKVLKDANEKMLTEILNRFNENLKDGEAK